MPGILDNAAWGVDVLVRDDGDLVIGANGDLMRISGPENLVQALKMRLRTVMGELPLHPRYGSRLNSEYIGQKNVPEFAINSELQTELSELVTEDPRFIRATITNAGAWANTQMAEIEITAVDSTRLMVSGLPNPRLLEVNTPMYDEVTTLPIGSIAQDEYLASDLASPIPLT
jgi:phage baseplate assembly protein W